MLKIIITGSESSGKTTLCKALSKHFKIPYTEEYAREYLNNLGREYKKEDLKEIAKKQLENEQTINKKNQLSLYDTDLITIKVWSEYKYGNCDKWILDQIEKQKSENRYYLLCRPDIPWEADPLRESPIDRDTLFGIHKREIKELEHEYLIIEGENRFKNSISKISNLIS